MGSYDFFKDLDDGDFIARLLASEAMIMEELARHPQHPNIVRYRGARVRRGRITGLVLDKYERTLFQHVKRDPSLDEKEKEDLMESLQSAVAHLHSLGLAHNDVNPHNIMIADPDKRLVLIDFGSCLPFGERTLSHGSTGWVEDDMDVWSRKEHDIFALGKIREWLEKPWFG
ncbi:Serine/threonine-protein kinase/endoribonuclease IRE2 [Diplogelasinospora grovesii]|uniref:Serine/threonine-protein kinase/endoribonuclease IRE2 n=1 Tax=Diplogelasinospora grovesii TaxID=303347 RepID=A0AAN6S297_9PEZI|nr:Serine/threonine-protein kinase/endoribonuclease IRE2 [Diplogelasinospora grovesii]